MSRVIGHFLPNGFYVTIILNVSGGQIVPVSRVSHEKKTYPLYANYNCQFTIVDQYAAFYDPVRKNFTIYDLYTGALLYQETGEMREFYLNEKYFLSFHVVDSKNIHIEVRELSNLMKITGHFSTDAISIALNKTKVAFIANNYDHTEHTLYIYDLSKSKTEGVGVDDTAKLYEEKTDDCAVLAAGDDFATISNIAFKQTSITTGFLSNRKQQTINRMLCRVVFSPSGSNLTACTFGEKQNKIVIYELKEDQYHSIHEHNENQQLEHVSYLTDNEAVISVFGKDTPTIININPNGVIFN